MIRSILFSFFLICTTLQLHAQCTALISGSGTICPGETYPLIIDLTGTAPWTVEYTINGNPQPPLTIMASPYTLVASQGGDYILTSVTASGCTAGTVSGIGEVTMYDEIIINCPDYELTCNQAVVTIDCSISGGVPPYLYEWIDPTGNPVLVQNPIVDMPGTYQFTVVDAAGCTAQNQCDCIGKQCHPFYHKYRNGGTFLPHPPSRNFI